MDGMGFPIFGQTLLCLFLLGIPATSGLGKRQTRVFFSALALPRHLKQEVLENPSGIAWNYQICLKGART
jgi:hypothetical protein